MKYVYFVSYSHTNGIASGFGQTEYHIDRQITELSHITKLRQMLETSGVSNPIIISFQLLRTE